MKAVRIADLKARLSEHLRAVRTGQTLTVLDRDTPVAKIVPYAAEPLDIRRATRRPRELTLPPPPASPTDGVAVMLRTGDAVDGVRRHPMRRSEQPPERSVSRFADCDLAIQAAERSAGAEDSSHPPPTALRRLVSAPGRRSTGS